jgi:ElaB/YqjD/DUF883 family membrane-anchored ribosome-binding protein
MADYERGAAALKEFADSIDVDRLRKDLDALKHDIAALGTEMTTALKSIAGTAQGQARRGYKRMQDNVTATVSDLRRQGTGAWDDAQETVESLEESFEQAVRQRPLSAVGLAIGLGFLIGVTWRR